jgi:ribosome-associated protein
MNSESIDQLISECNFKAVRSGGKGGQNVNKVSSRVELYFDVNASAMLTSVQKLKLQQNLKNKISQSGILRLVSSSARSQVQNKKLVIEKFIGILNTSLKEKKKRKKVSIPVSSREERLTKKKLRSELKKLRMKPDSY